MSTDRSWTHSARCHARRRAALFLGHAPGFSLATGEGLPRALWWPNAIAAAATVMAMLVAAAMTSPAWKGGLAAWLVGHLAWSTWGAWRLPRASPARPRTARGWLSCDKDCGFRRV